MQPTALPGELWEFMLGVTIHRSAMPVSLDQQFSGIQMFFHF